MSYDDARKSHSIFNVVPLRYHQLNRTTLTPVGLILLDGLLIPYWVSVELILLKKDSIENGMAINASSIKYLSRKDISIGRNYNQERQPKE